MKATRQVSVARILELLRDLKIYDVDVRVSTNADAMFFLSQLANFNKKYRKYDS